MTFVNTPGRKNRLNGVASPSVPSVTSAGETATYPDAVSSASLDRVRSAMTRLPFRS